MKWRELTWDANGNLLSDGIIESLKDMKPLRRRKLQWSQTIHRFSDSSSYKHRLLPDRCAGLGAAVGGYEWRGQLSEDLQTVFATRSRLSDCLTGFPEETCCPISSTPGGQGAAATLSFEAPPTTYPWQKPASEPRGEEAPRKCLKGRGKGWQYGQHMRTLDKRRQCRTS